MENSSDRKIVCLINPLAANKRWKRRRKLRAELVKRLPGSCLDTPKTKEETVEMTRSICPSADLVVAVGGDGTIADVLQGIFESGRQDRVVFGVIPFGSGNAFRKSLGIPRNPFKAIKYILEGDIFSIDLIQIEDRVAAFASVGSTAAVTGEKMRHSIPGLFGHLLAARKLLFYKRKQNVLELRGAVDQEGRQYDNLTVTSRFLDCVIGNSNYFGYSWLVAPQARLDDGYLDIILFEMPPLIYIFLFPLIYFGWVQRKLRHFKAREVVIKGEGLEVQYNGEYLGSLDSVRVKVLPAAIKVTGNRKKAARFLVNQGNASEDQPRV
ncbi:MAG: Transcription regulator [contains diacylglycerol kinase catalytic domain] [Candidatus Saccharicenans subterraneus]|uniref:Transcription regulator [contains diacylglycerol kinase catalytic domain] n=1 Tax=Candidatus Saccharicenans subterraneus TaxID=2508984 RepID=A0A3E2BNV5_9BACT|nr:MAG: Transcription regulator [contains diacylglycerol kinase catalytic domain] [Candidatus Saccharicenans subterraneum]